MNNFERNKKIARTERIFEKLLKGIAFIGLCFLLLGVVITPIAMVVFLCGAFGIGNILLSAVKIIVLVMLVDFLLLGLVLMIAGIWMYVVSKKA